MIARFHTLDPLAEKYSHQSHFVYADNNPIAKIDFMGMNGVKSNNIFVRAATSKRVQNEVKKGGNANLIKFKVGAQAAGAKFKLIDNGVVDVNVGGTFGKVEHESSFNYGSTDQTVTTTAMEGAAEFNIMDVAGANSKIVIGETTFNLPENGEPSVDADVAKTTAENSGTKAEEGEYGLEVAFAFVSVGVSANFKNIKSSFNNLGNIIQEFLGGVKDAITNPQKGNDEENY